LDISKHDNKEGKLSIAFTKIVRMLDKNTININFLKDLSGYNWTVQAQGDKALKFTAGINTAIVMPLRCE